jgi:hypothetical protein
MGTGKKDFLDYKSRLSRTMTASQYMALTSSPEFLSSCASAGWYQHLTEEEKKLAVKDLVATSSLCFKSLTPNNTPEERRNAEKFMIEEGMVPPHFTKKITCRLCGPVLVPESFVPTSSCPWCETTKRLQDEIDDFETNGSQAMREMMKSAPRVVCLYDDIPW